MNKEALQEVSFTPLKWQEGVQFAKHRYRADGLSTTSAFKMCMLMISFAFCFILWAISGFITPIIVVVLAAILLSVVLAFALKAASGAPLRISLTERAVVIDRERVHYGELLSVRLGYMQYDEVEYPVASFIFKDGREKMVGLPDKGYFKTMKESLSLKGVRVET